MSSRFGPQPTQNNNNHMTDRSSTRCTKPPGGGSTMGSLIYGGGGDADNSASFMDERKTRRFHSQTPEHNPIVNKDSFYGTPTAPQRERECVTGALGTLSRNALVVALQKPILSRHGSSNNNMADCLGGVSGANEGDNQRRTKRMYAPPGGTSSFKVG